MKKAPKLRSIPSKVVESKDQHEKEELSYNPQPCIEISESVLPEIKKWNVDGKYKCVVELQMQSIGKNDYGHDKGKMCARFKVTKIGLSNE